MSKLFWLQRIKDETGLSGTGIVCEGVQFSDGRCVMHWIGKIDSIVHHKNIKDVQEIHGHNGSTKIIWSLKDSMMVEIDTAGPRENGSIIMKWMTRIAADRIPEDQVELKKYAMRYAKNMELATFIQCQKDYYDGVTDDILDKYKKKFKKMMEQKPEDLDTSMFNDFIVDAVKTIRDKTTNNNIGILLSMVLAAPHSKIHDDYLRFMTKYVIE